MPIQGRPSHRRSFSNILPPPSMASTSPTGAFTPLTALPTRRRSTRPTFQLGRDDEEDSPDESSTTPDPRPMNNDDDDDDDHLHVPRLRLKTKFVSSFDQPVNAAVPFPRSSPLPSPTPPLSPSVSRTSSTPILLANGKPLKSSLKSSSSSPNIPFPPQSLVPSIMFPQLHHHQRACSAPATPVLDPPSSPSSSSSSSMPSPSLPHQKNVHFPSQEEGGLATVRVYKRSAKPASLLRKGDETETETEGESSSAPNAFNLPFVWGSRWNHTANSRTSAFPFPKFGAGPVPKKHSPLADHDDRAKAQTTFEIDMSNSSPIPARGADRAEGNLFFESLGFTCDAGTERVAKPHTLTGTVIVRNISYHKTVAVRYTLDDWVTTNDVLARHEKSLVALPERFLLASLPLIDADGCPDGEKRREVVCRPRGFEDLVLSVGDLPAWDRFRFDISLERFESSIQERTMWFVGRYSSASPVDGVTPTTPGEEWWDNNSGNNYRVSFVKAVVDDCVEDEVQPAEPGAGYRRNVVFSAPPAFAPSKPCPAPPQISSSLSYPVSVAQRDQAATSYAVLTQRLRKFGFANYAAPSPATSMPTVPTDEQDESSDKASPVDSLSTDSGTANTSADSTPLQTPTQDDFHFVGNPGHDVDKNVLVHDAEPARDDDEERKLSWGLNGGLRMQDGFPATILPLKDEDDRTPTQTPISSAANPLEISSKGRGRAVEPERSALDSLPSLGAEMSTSPPFSMLAGMELRNGMFASKEAHSPQWPWTSENSHSQDAKDVRPSHPTPAHAAMDDAPIRTASPVQRPSSPLMPPQRKKAHHHSHSLPAQGPTFSIGRTSSSSSKSGSSSGSSGSGSDTMSSASKRGSSRTTTTTTIVPPRPKLASPQPWPVAPQNQLRRVMSPPPLAQAQSGFGQRRMFEVKADGGDAVNELGVQRRASSSSNSNSNSMELMSPASPAGDAAYQAFIRQWCFAQGPPPTGSPRKNEKMGPLAADVVVR